MLQAKLMAPKVCRALPLVLVCSQGYCLRGYHHICHPHCIRTCRCSKKKINKDEFFFVRSSDYIKKEIGWAELRLKKFLTTIQLNDM